jgi:hypothetical protein
VDYCKKENIPLQAYLAIARNSRSCDEGLVALGDKYKVSTAVIILCYSLRKGFAPVVKAENPQHLLANLEAETLDITDEDIALMDSWDEGDKGSIGAYLGACQEGKADDVHSTVVDGFNLIRDFQSVSPPRRRFTKRRQNRRHEVFVLPLSIAIPSTNEPQEI